MLEVVQDNKLHFPWQRERVGILFAVSSKNLAETGPISKPIY